MNILNISFTFSILLYSLFVIAAPAKKTDTAGKDINAKVETNEQAKNSQYNKMKTEQHNDELKEIHERTKSNNQHETPPKYITSSFAGLEYKEPEQLQEEITKKLPDDTKALEAILHCAKNLREYEFKKNPLPEEKSPDAKALSDKNDNFSSFSHIRYQETNPRGMIFSISSFNKILQFALLTKGVIDLPMTDINEREEEREKKIHYKKIALKLSPKPRINQDEDAWLSQNNALPKKDLAKGGGTNSDSLTHLCLDINIFEGSSNSNLNFAEDFWRKIEVKILNQKDLGNNITDSFHTSHESEKQSYCLQDWINIGYLLSNKEKYYPNNTLLFELSFYNIGDAEEERKYQKEMKRNRDEVDEHRLRLAMQYAIRSAKYKNAPTEHSGSATPCNDEKDIGTPWNPYEEKTKLSD